MRIVVTNFTIGKMAKLAQISRDTIRFYEREGLIEKPCRLDNGYRIYSEKTIARLQFIQRAKKMGFTLKEIDELLSIRQTTQNTCDEAKQQIIRKIENVQEKLLELNRLSRALKALSSNCKKNREQNECPLLEALEEQHNKIKSPRRIIK